MSDKPNNFFSFFNGSQKKKETKKLVFDENYFNLQITGGKFHSERIIIEALSIVDSEKLETDIKWFQITPNHDFKTLDITGSEYQPSIEDVGSKFMIQVVPIQEDRQYEGMPKSMEIGPLERDETIQEEIDEMLENEKMTVLVSLEKIAKQDVAIEAELPLSCILKITLKNIELQIKKNEQILHMFDLPLEAQYPSCSSMQGTTEYFNLKLDSKNEFLMKAADNAQRDIILSVIKGFYGKSIWKDQGNANEEKESDDEDEQEQEQKEENQEQAVDKPEEGNFLKQEINQDNQQSNHDENEKISETSQENKEEQIQQNEQVPNPDKNENNEILNEQFENPVIIEQEFEQQKNEIENQPTEQHQEEVIVDITSQIMLVQKESVVVPEEELQKQQQQQKNRIDHKFQSVIITAESNKEERASPTKKKEKKNNADLYMYLNENVRLKQEIDQFKQSQQKDQELLKKQQTQISTLTEQLTNCTSNYYQLEEECSNQKKIMYSLNDQKVFLQQDINMYKTQLLEITELSTNQKEEISQLQKRLTRQAVSQDLTEAKKQIDALKEQLTKRDMMLEAANQDHIQAMKKIDGFEKEIESLQNQLIHEKKKYESLAIEKGMKQPNQPQRQNERNIKQEKHVAQSMIQLDDADRYSIDISQSLQNLDSDIEVGRLKTQIMHLEATLRSLKIAYEQDIRMTKGKTGKGLHGSSKDIKYLQHIANNMAEIITEKEMQLENQKQINKELLTKLQILQKQ